jgi:transposase InsO family protein
MCAAIGRTAVAHTICYLIRDRDQVYGVAVRHRLRAMGIRDKPIAPGSPWQDSFAERLIGSIRRECVDHLNVHSAGCLPTL